MKTYTPPRWRRIGIAFLTAGVLGLIGAPTPARAVEREGTTLFFSLADLKDTVRSAPFSLFPSGITAYVQLDWHAAGDSRVERNWRWGHGLGVDGYGAPGTHRPLWGY